ncbi:MAG: TolC family protein [Proteobacteria bacterium]|nr:TolC family protein [Pseudomonadota bacterium]
MNSSFRRKVVFISSFFAVVSMSYSITLDEYLSTVQKSNTQFQAFELQKQSAEIKNEQADLVLSPYLIFGAKYYSDETPKPLQVFPAIIQTKSEGNEYSLGVAKKFATGTEIKAFVTEQHPRSFTATGAQPSPYLGISSFSLSQSLWKDFFGAQTRARHHREAAATRFEKGAIEIQALQFLSQAEAAYWQLLYQKNELKVRQESLDRADRLVKWTKNRVANGLSQSNDLLQAEALFTQRELQFITAQDEYQNAQLKLKDFMGAESGVPEVDVSGDLDLKRDQLVTILSAEKNMRADAWLAQAEADLQKKVSDETTEGLRPDLVLEGAYSNLTTQDQRSDIRGHLNDGKLPNKSVALKLTMDLDFFGRSAARRSARLNADAASLKAGRLKSESDRDIVESQRRYNELSRRVEAVKKLVAIQKKKYEKEQERLRNGRSTTFQVISFEQEVAEGEVLLYKLLSEQRKIEAATRAYVGNL